MRFKTSLKLDITDQPIVGFDENVDLKGRSFFAVLFTFISNKQVIELKYKNFKKDKEQVFNVHPYYLKQYNKR